ncbi:MAG: DUF4912 domain-containing protein [Chthoniobacterales bacterium]
MSEPLTPGRTFAVSNTPLIPEQGEQQAGSISGGSANIDNLGHLPRSYGESVLFVVARDAKTLFAFWDIDWRSVFGDAPPPDQKAHLRIFDEGGAEQSGVVVEPFAGESYLPVPNGGQHYTVELGYNDPTGTWNAVARSAAIATPPDQLSEEGPFEIALIPFHLRFQRMIDFFRAANFDSASLSDLIGRVQRKTVTSPVRTLTMEEAEVLGLFHAKSEQGSPSPETAAESENGTWPQEKLRQLLQFGDGSSGENFSGSSRSA